MRRRLLLIAPALALSAALAGCGSLSAPSIAEPAHSTPAATPTSTTAPTEPPAIPEYAAGAVLAATLPLIDPATPAPEYRRDEFGSAWADVDGNGCSQRQDVLARDLIDKTIAADGCTVLTGTLFDPYTATTIAFEHDRVAKTGNPGSQGVQIDHIVSLSAAHAGGAWKWTAQQRLEFANDLTHLVAVDGPTNASKSDSGPSGWLPPNTAYSCVYALEYAEIAGAWKLAVERADRAALVTVLNECAA